MQIKRDYYLQKLIHSRGNRMIKVITGIRRCGKSYLLLTLFQQYLLENGTPENHIITVDLEDRENKALRDPDALLHYILDRTPNKDEHYYVLLDEVQLVSEFEDVLNSFLKKDWIDVYVTGSNAKFLSKDVITEFRGRGDEIRIHPLSFCEFAAYKQEQPEKMWMEYMLYGGLPQVVLENDTNKKREYLRSQFNHTYLKDIKERNSIQNIDDLDEIVNTIASSIGALTNPNKIANTFHSVKQSDIDAKTIAKYLEYMEDAFLIERSIRYDIKGRKYIDTPYKYYFEDLGLRNARIGFRQTEETHIMENMIYNELRAIGCQVDVGQVSVEQKDEEGKRKRVNLEVDFVCNQGYNRVYIQSAYALSDNTKRRQELASLNKISDGFRRIVIAGSMQPTCMNDDGILFVNVLDFLMEPSKYVSE
ncbi:MAG: ATP-binding protein [Paludibacteraceae bacterium]|nr:ATP-binding protein [Paludibacteraceae bacterium]